MPKDEMEDSIWRGRMFTDRMDLRRDIEALAGCRAALAADPEALAHVNAAITRKVEAYDSRSEALGLKSVHEAIEELEVRRSEPAAELVAALDAIRSGAKVPTKSGAMVVPGGILIAGIVRRLARNEDAIALQRGMAIAREGGSKAAA